MRLAFNKFIERARDPYRLLEGEFERCDHLDNLLRPGRLIPYTAPTAITGGQTNLGALKRAAYDGNLYGLGTGSADAYATMHKVTSPTASTWTALANPAASGSVQYPMLEEYHGALYFWPDTAGNIGKHDIASPNASDMASWQSVTLSPSIGPGHYFKSNDVLNIAYGYKLGQLADTTFTPDKLVLNPEHRIASMAEWNDYECIGCRTANDNTVVHFWDGVQNAPLFSREIPGEYLLALRNVGGELVAVTAPAASSILRQRISFYVLRGSEFQRVRQHVSFEGAASSASVILPERTARVKDNQLYFCAGLQTGAATTEYGIYRFGLNEGRYAFNRARFATSGNTETFAADIGALEWFGDYPFAVHTSHGTITKAGGSGNPSCTYRIGQLDFGKKAQKKKAVEVSVSTAPLPAGESVTVKYAVDGGSLTTLFTHSGTGKVSTVKRSVKAIPNFSLISIQAEPTVRAEITEVAIDAIPVANKYG